MITPNQISVAFFSFLDLLKRKKREKREKKKKKEEEKSQLARSHQRKKKKRKRKRKEKRREEKGDLLLQVGAEVGNVGVGNVELAGLKHCWFGFCGRKKKEREMAGKKFEKIRK